MKKYSVRIYYSTFVDVEVEAEKEKEAIEKAYDKLEDMPTDKFLENIVQSESDPDIIDIN